MLGWNGEKMIHITDRFTEQANGYDKTQVNSYIHKLSDEYEQLYRMLTDLTAQYDELQKQSSADMEAISRVLVSAEKNADEIIMHAESKAAQMMENAQRQLQKAQEEESRITSEIYHILTKLRLVSSSVVQSRSAIGG